VRIGIDIGGTKIESVAIDADLTVLATSRTPVRSGPEGITTGAIEAVDDLMRTAACPVDSIGIGVPGAIRRGVVQHARNISIESLDLEAAVAAATGVPVRVANDVNAAALGAWRLCGSGSSAFAYLNLGTGMAAGLVLDGHLWEGARGLAGEIGYISVDPNGPDHVDGLAGLLEAYASGSGVIAQWGVDGPTAVDVFSAAAAGDPRAAAIRDGVFFGAASAVRVLALAYDADSVVVGGGLTGLGQELHDGMAAYFEAWSEASPFIASLELGRITRVMHDERPVHAIGAAILGGSRG